MKRAFRRWICRPSRALVTTIVAAVGVYVLVTNNVMSNVTSDTPRFADPVATGSSPVLNISRYTPSRFENKSNRSLQQATTGAANTKTRRHDDLFLDVCTEKETDKTRSEVILAGVPRSRKVYLTIGLATVWRPGGSYFFSTVDSLLGRSTSEQQEDMTIVTMLADRNQSYNHFLLQGIKRRYCDPLKEGLLLVIRQPDTEQLFRTTPAKRTYDDDVERVRWRSKQNLDYAALMEFSANLSQYYLQIEDDVLAAPHYIDKLHQFIKDNTNKTWSRLDVSPKGFIGKLFKTADLHKLVTVLRTFYLEQPCDFLLNYFHQLMVQPKVILRKGKLFFHQGKHSSLGNVTRGVENVSGPEGKTESVEKHTRKYSNPPGVVVTSMNLYGDHEAKEAYNLQSTKFFWAQDIAPGDFLTVVFDRPQRVKEVIVETGFSAKNQRDSARHGRVEVGEKADKPNEFDDPPSKDQPLCTATHVLGNFEQGRFQGHVLFHGDVKCLSIVIAEAQKEWLVIREIVVVV